MPPPPDRPPTRPLLNETEAAAYLSRLTGRHWSVEMLKRRARDGRLAHQPTRIGRGYRPDDLDAFLATLPPAALPPAARRAGVAGPRAVVQARRRKRIRTVVTLRAEGMTLRAIAAVIGVTHEQVRKDLLAAAARNGRVAGPGENS